jgi:hypothetical protein
VDAEVTVFGDVAFVVEDERAGQGGRVDENHRYGRGGNDQEINRRALGVH